jgi:hypothetical protein
MKHFARDCVDQTIRSCFWAFVIALVIARCFLGDRDALSVSSTVMEHVALPFAGASVVLITCRHFLGKR